MSGLRGEIPQSPDVQVLGGEAVMVKGAAALDLYRLALLGVRYQRQTDQIDPSPRLLSTVAALKVAAQAAEMSDCGHADVRPEPTSAPLMLQLGITAAAHELGMTTRHVRRLAQAGELGGRKVGGTWLVDRAAVLAHRLERESA